MKISALTLGQSQANRLLSLLIPQALCYSVSLGKEEQMGSPGLCSHASFGLCYKYKQRRLFRDRNYYSTMPLH